MKERSYIIEYGFNYRIARGIIENSVFMLTMKHHGIIFAIGAGVPVIAVALDDYYVRKNFGALKLFGQEEFLARLDDLFVRGIMEKKIETIFKERDKIRARINENREIMRSADGEVIVKFLDRQKS
jgi:polysaccharide pyruvyl transferase WcaK-like protein